MTDNAPERILVTSDGCYDYVLDADDCEGSSDEAHYTRTDLYEAAQARVAELEGALERFNGHRIGFGQSTDLNMLADAQKAARAALTTGGGE